MVLIGSLDLGSLIYSDFSYPSDYFTISLFYYFHYFIIPLLHFLHPVRHIKSIYYICICTNIRISHFILSSLSFPSL